MYILLTIIILICVVSLFINKNIDIFNNIICLLLFIISILLLFVNDNVFDFKSYEMMYELDYDKVEYFYYKLSQLFRNIGINYLYYRLTVNIVTLILLIVIVNKYLHNSKQKIFVFLTYIIFLYPYNIIQTRNMIATMIFFFALYVLMGDHKYKKILYVVITLFASGFHVIFLLYLPFVFIENINKNKLIYGTLLLFVFISFMFGFYKSHTINILSNYSGIELNAFLKLNKYVENPSNLGFVLFYIHIFVNYMLSYYIYKIYSLNKIKSEKIIMNNLVNSLHCINLMIFLYFPIIAIASVFDRIFLNISLLNFIIYSYIIFNDKILIKYKLNVILMFLIIVFMYYFKTNLFDLQCQILQNNLFVF